MPRLYFLFSLILMISIAACTDDTPTQTATPLESVSLQLSWTHEYSSVAFYAAIEDGFFQDEGLTITLEEGGFGESGYIEPIDQVVNGEVDFGMTSAAGLITARANGKPVVGVLSILQRDPFAIISLPDTNILTPQDLIGKTVAISDGAATHNTIAMLQSQGINPSEVNIIPRTDFGVDPLLNGEVDALGGWIINEGVAVQEAGYEPNFLLLSDYGLNSYSFVLFTTESIINERPEMVQKTVRAVLKGLEDIIEDPEHGVDYILKFAPDLDREGQERRLLATIPLMNTPNIPLGGMSSQDWAMIHQLLVDNDIITESIAVEETYTLAFLGAE